MSDQQTQMPARTQFRRLAECKSLKEAFETKELRDLVAQAIPKHLNPDNMLRTWIQAASKQPLIYEADMRQALGAFQSLAYLGLAPNTQLQHAWIIPFRTTSYNKATKKRDIPGVDLQIVIGYPGYIELAHRSGSIKSIHADVVYDARQEDFNYSYGTDQHLHHGMKPPGYEPRGPIQYAYCRIDMGGGVEQFEVMTYREIIAIRNRSQAYLTAIRAKERAETERWNVPAAYAEAPWVRDEAEMAKKTAARRLFKWIPKSPQLQAASSLEDASDAGKRMDFGPVIEGTVTPMDGLQEVEQEEPPRDPGATFGIRQEPQQAEQRQPARPGPPEFDAILLDEFGEPADEGRPYLSAVAFARAVAERRERLSDIALSNQFNEFNAEAIADAIQDPAAAAILGGLQGGQSAPPADTPIVAVEPPTDRGTRLSWTGYVRAFRAALDNVPMASLDRWIEAQRPQLEACPLAQRIQCVQALHAHASGEPLPGWLADVVAAKPAAAKPQSTDPDGQWVDSTALRLVEIKVMEDPEEAQRELKALRENKNTVETMRRLQAQRTILYETAKTAFVGAQAEILQRREGGD